VCSEILLYWDIPLICIKEHIENKFKLRDILLSSIYMDLMNAISFLWGYETDRGNKAATYRHLLRHKAAKTYDIQYMRQYNSDKKNTYWNSSKLI